jgi:hypothetical protein
MVPEEVRIWYWKTLKYGTGRCENIVLDEAHIWYWNRWSPSTGID